MNKVVRLSFFLSFFLSLNSYAEVSKRNIGKTISCPGFQKLQDENGLWLSQVVFGLNIGNPDVYFPQPPAYPTYPELNTFYSRYQSGRVSSITAYVDFGDGDPNRDLGGCIYKDANNSRIAELMISLADQKCTAINNSPTFVGFSCSL